jgi:hypothetical protein
MSNKECRISKFTSAVRHSLFDILNFRVNRQLISCQFKNCEGSVGEAGLSLIFAGGTPAIPGDPPFFNLEKSPTLRDRYRLAAKVLKAGQR